LQGSWLIAEAAAVNMAMSTNESTPIITNLLELKEVAENFIQCYTDNLDVIHQYALRDIESTLSNRPLDVLLKLRSELFSRAQQAFKDELSEKALPNRKAVHTTANDTVHLGCSLVNKSLTKETDKLCITKNTDSGTATAAEAGTDSVKSLADLILVVAQLQATTQTLQTSVNNLSDENKALRKRVAELEKTQESQSSEDGPETADVDISDMTTDRAVSTNEEEQNNQLLTAAPSATALETHSYQHNLMGILEIYWPHIC
jgi:hypothetical protein